MFEIQDHPEVQYQCFLSKHLRAACLATKTTHKVKSLVESALHDFLTNHPDAVANVKEEQEKAEPGYLVSRQADIRDKPEGEIMFKAFFQWSVKEQMWHVCLEGAQETSFEDGEPNF